MNKVKFWPPEQEPDKENKLDEGEPQDKDHELSYKKCSDEDSEEEIMFIRSTN